MQLQIIETEAREISTALVAYLRSPQSVYRLQFPEHSREVNAALAAFSELSPNEEERERSAQLSGLFGETTIVATRLLDLKDSLYANTSSILEQRSELENVLEQQMQFPARVQMNEAQSAVHSIYSQTNKVTLALLIIGLLFVFAAALLIYNRISNPINRLVLATKRVAGGDLSTRVTVESGDEIGQLAAAFNEMIASREEAERALVLSEAEQRRLADENAVSATIGRIASSSVELEDVYDALAQKVRTLVRFDWLAISILDQKSEIQRVDYVSGNLVKNLKRGTVLPLSGTLVSAVAEHRDFIVDVIDPESSTERKYSNAGPIAEAGFPVVWGSPCFPETG